MRIHHDIEFMKLRKRIRSAQNISEKIAMLKQIVGLNPRDPKNLRLRKKYKEELELLKLKKQQKKKLTKSVYEQLRFKKQAILVGKTNTGKSTLLSRLTGTTPAIGDSPFTTYKPEIGMMNYKDVAIQIIELPPLYREDSDKKKYRFIRDSDVLCICARTIEQFNFVKEKLETFRISLTNVLSQNESNEFRSSEGVIKKAAFIASWISLQGINLNVVNIDDVESIMWQIYHLLNIKRMYCAKKGKIQGSPLVFPANQEITLAHFIESLDKRLLERFKKAKIVGVSAKYGGEIVGLGHVLHDGDTVELVK